MHGLHLQRAPEGAAPPALHEWRVIHEWFAGWRWEHHHAGELVDESLQSFETREQCTADAARYRSGNREVLSSGRADQSREYATEQIAA
ncbi:MAG: hypothetical protein JWM26_4326 [Betaproteobacteria bacterium]|nr:hypothetical protein [Betaproteobacteria bacterium]